MERKFLKVGWAQTSLTSAGGATSLLVAWQKPPIKIDERAREVCFLKRFQMHFAEYSSGAAFRVGIRSYLVRDQRTLLRSNVLTDITLYLAQNPGDNFIWGFDTNRSDSYSNLDDSLLPRPEPAITWPDGFEPVLLNDENILANQISPALNPGTIAVLFTSFWWYWIERLAEKEYEKLKLRYGKLG